MKSESDPITNDEYVARLIWQYHYKRGMAPPIIPKAFVPKRNESEGISVFRMACVANPEDVLAAIAPENRDLYAIALLSVADLLDLGLSVQSDPIPEVPGHAVIPEVCIENASGEDAWLRRMRSLASLANLRIVREPKV